MKSIIQSIILSLVIIGYSCQNEICDIKVTDNTKENNFLYDLNNFDRYIPNHNQNKKFNLLSNVKTNNLFRLQSNGKLYTGTLIDRELLCKTTEVCCHNKDPCEIKLLVAVKSDSSEEPRTFDCRVQIEDINDNIPKFPNEKITISIKESEPVGTLFPLPFASDLDSERYSVRDYKLEDKSIFPPMFSLEQHRPINSLNLQLTQKLDREKRANYELILQAIDRGNPPKTGRLLINIIVLDVNDNSPQLIRNNYAINFEESKFSTEPILTIEAKDDDENENAKLFFKIIDENPLNNEATKYFRIEENTGKIFLKEKLDYEKQETHKFFVEISNNVGHVETATATVLIHVDNVNDEKPEITVDYLAVNNKNVLIKENDAKKKFVAIVTVNDNDKGPGGQVNCRLLNYENVFELVKQEITSLSNQYRIFTRLSLDRESIGYYEIQMECEDKGYPTQKSKAHIKVNVQDVNDNSPIIKIDKSISVYENQPIGTLVTHITATDIDEGKNSELKYSINESDELTQKYLEINPLNGELRTKLVIDREQENEPIINLSVTLTVSDKGDPPLSATQKFYVTIKDVNDNPPVFGSDLFKFAVTENQPPKYTLGEIVVTDKDESTNLRVSLSHSANEISSPFVLFNKDNKYYLNTTRSLDREKEQTFSLKVIASDGNEYRSHTVSASIIITVIDENDHAPTFIFPMSKNFTKTISFLENVETIVVTVSASDKDSQETHNGKFEFQLINDPKNLFKIDSNSGKITTTRLMNRQDMGKCVISVLVRDQGNPPKDSSLQLTIVIDDSKPIFNSGFDDSNRDLNDENKKNPAQFILSKETFLITSLIILLLFLLLCIFLILYMRHIRGLFPMLPDIFEGCSCFNTKRSNQKKNTSYHKSICNIPINESQHFISGNPQIDFQQQVRNNENNTIPFYFNQYDSSSNTTPLSIDHKLPVNQFRQYETMKYQHFSPPIVTSKSVQNYNYDQLFYHHPRSSPIEEACVIPIASPMNPNNFYDSRMRTIPSNLHRDLTACHRIVNNIDPSPLISDENFSENKIERFSSNPCLKSDQIENIAVETHLTKTPDIRRHNNKKSDKIDTYAVTYPKEQSTFV